MPAKLPKHTADAIDRCHREGLETDLQVIATTYNTIYKTVCQRKRKIQVETAIGRSYLTRKPGRKSIITPAVKTYVYQLLQEDLTLYQDEIADYIHLEFDIQLSQSAVLKLLKKLKQTLKQVQVTAKQCDEELQRAWRRKRIGWHAEQLVFLDESASNERTADRKWVNAPIRMPAKAKRWLKKSERWSVLPVYTISGYIEAITYQGSITAEIFEDWLEQQVLPNCNR
jgi:transposase